MARIKVSLFFHTENEEEKRAYEYLCSLGRKKSTTLTKLINSYIAGYTERQSETKEDKRALLKGQKMQETEQPKRKDETYHAEYEPIHVKKEEPHAKSESPDKLDEVIPASEAVRARENRTTSEEIPVPKKESLDNNLILKGLQAFRL